MSKNLRSKTLKMLSLILSLGLFMMVSNQSFGQGTDATIYGKISDEKEQLTKEIVNYIQINNMQRIAINVGNKKIYYQFIL